MLKFSTFFVESKLCLSDRGDTYQLREFTLYRYDSSQSNIRTYHGTAVYIKNDLNCTKIPYRCTPCNFDNLETNDVHNVCLVKYTLYTRLKG